MAANPNPPPPCICPLRHLLITARDDLEKMLHHLGSTNEGRVDYCISSYTNLKSGHAKQSIVALYSLQHQMDRCRMNKDNSSICWDRIRPAEVHYGPNDAEDDEDEEEGYKSA